MGVEQEVWFGVERRRRDIIEHTKYARIIA
jgi:hypothetical protein